MPMLRKIFIKLTFSNFHGLKIKRLAKVQALQEFKSL